MSLQITPASRAAVTSRSAGYCEAGIPGTCGGRGEAVHHRNPRGMGGTRVRRVNAPCNLLHLCTPCHLYVESHRAWALARGLLLLDSEDAATTPVRLGGLYGVGWFLLAEDGLLLWADDPEIREVGLDSEAASA